MFLYLVEIFLYFAVAAIGFTQVVAPLWRGTRLFPWWRRRDLAESFTEVQEDLDRKALERKLQKLTAKKEHYARPTPQASARSVRQPGVVGGGVDGETDSSGDRRDRVTDDDGVDGVYRRGSRG